MLRPELVACKQQIIFAYEELSLQPEEIASQFDDYGFSSENIQTLLADYSAKYRQNLKDRTDSVLQTPAPQTELEELVQEYRHLSRTASNDLVKERSLKFLINEHKGRNDLASRGLALKERQQGAGEVNTAKRAAEFIDVMKQINDKLQQALTGKTSPQTLELTNT